MLDAQVKKSPNVGVYINTPLWFSDSNCSACCLLLRIHLPDRRLGPCIAVVAASILSVMRQFHMALEAPSLSGCQAQRPIKPILLFHDRFSFGFKQRAARIVSRPTGYGGVYLGGRAGHGAGWAATSGDSRRSTQRQITPLVVHSQHFNHAAVGDR